MAQIKNAAGLVLPVDGVVAEHRLARSVRALLKDEFPFASGHCAPSDRSRIDADDELAAYFVVVAKAGAWSEERLRVAHQRVGPVPRRSPDEIGSGPLTVPNICRALPIWRQWGRLLIEAEQAKVAGKEAGLTGTTGDNGGGKQEPVSPNSQFTKTDRNPPNVATGAARPP